MVWTEEETDYFDTNIDAYLPAFALGFTYSDTKPLREKVQKEEGNLLNCTLYNNGPDAWSYEAQLPHIELWYKGVWIELVSPFADNLMIVEIKRAQDRRFDIPEETMMQYTPPLDGIYRLVIYGENEEFVVSDTFIIEG